MGRTEDHGGNGKSFADRRAEAGAPVEEAEEPDFAEERSPSPSDPPNAPGEGVGGEDEGYKPQTEV